MQFCRWGLAGALLAGCSIATAQVRDAPPAPRFDIQRIVVEGNTILPQAEVNRLIAPYLGKNRDFGDVQQALEALQDAYLARGYSAVRVLVPEQDLVSGRVRLQVVESRIRNVRVEGNQFFSEGNVRAALPSLKPGEPPNTREVGENVQLSNENPAKQINVVLETTDESGKSDAVVRVIDENPSRYTISADNTGTPQTGNARVGFGYQNSNVFDRDHVFTAQYITSPTKIDDVKIFGVGYRVPLYAWSGAFDVYGGYSDVNSGTVQGLFNVAGKGSIFGMRYSQMLPRIDTYTQKVSLGWDYRAFQQNVALVDTAGSLLADITVRPVTLGYTGRQSKVGRDIAVVASFTENLPGGSDGGQDAFTANRPGAPSRYKIWRVGGSWSETLSGDNLVRGVVAGQYTRDPLVPVEQFGMGGADSVRGFYERESASDIGIRVSGEVYGSDFGERIGAGWRARMLAFVDAAQGYDRDPQRAGKQGLSSVGLGVRMSQGKSISLRLDWGHVLNPSAARPDNLDRLHFAAVFAF